jgi:hypothetical protein
LGATSVSILHVSDYEGADIIHNLDSPIPQELEGKFEEHVRERRRGMNYKRVLAGLAHRLLPSFRLMERGYVRLGAF